MNKVFLSPSGNNVLIVAKSSGRHVTLKIIYKIYTVVRNGLCMKCVHKYKFINDDKKHNETEPFENDFNLKENACHLCNVIFKRKEHLMNHLKVNHKEYLQYRTKYAVE